MCGGGGGDPGSSDSHEYMFFFTCIYVYLQKIYIFIDIWEHIWEKGPIGN